MTQLKTHWPMIMLLWVTGLLAAAQFAKLTLTMAPLGELYPGAPVALAVSGVSVVGILVGAISGFLVARIGARRSVLIAIVASATVSLVQAIPMSFAAFMATRLVEGIGHLLLVVALPTMMAALATPKDKSVVMGLWGAFFGVSYAILGVVLPATDAWLGPRGVYAAHGVLLLAVAPVLWLLLPHIMSGGQKIPRLLPLHRLIYTTPRYFAPGLGHGIYTSIFIALVAFLPTELGAPWLIVVLPLTNLTGTFLSGFIARRVRASVLSIWCFAAAGVMFALLAVTGSVWIAIAALFATGVTAGANFAAVPELNDTPEDQARANGALAQIGNVGTFSGTPLYAIAVAGGLWGIAGLSIAICLAGVIFAGFAYKAARLSAVSDAITG